MRKINFYFLTILVLIIGVFQSFSQARFQKTYGTNGEEVGRVAKEFPGGGYVVAGYVMPFGSYYKDIFIMRTDVNGDTLWTKIIGDTATDEAFDLLIASDGNIIVAGSVNIYSMQKDDAFLMKLDGNGNILWLQRITGNGWGWEGIQSVTETYDGGFAFAGYAFVNGANPKPQVTLGKTDSVGNLLWIKEFQETYFMQGFNVKQTSDSGYMVIGGAVTVNEIQNIVIKTDVNGDTVWTKSLTTSLGLQGWIMETVSDGVVVLASNSCPSLYIYKIDLAGNIIWNHLLGVSAPFDFLGLCKTKDGGFMVCGNSVDIYLLKLDSMGIGIWGKNYLGDSTDYGYSVQQTADGGYVMCGSTLSFGEGGNDILLIKTDSIGDLDCYPFYFFPSTSNSPLIESHIPMTINSFGYSQGDTFPIRQGCIVNDACQQLLGQEEMNMQRSALVYPNPSNGNLYVSVDPSMDGVDQYRFDLFNAEGKRMESFFLSQLKRISGNTYLVERGNLTDGIYFYSITCEGQLPLRGKIILNP